MTSDKGVVERLLEVDGVTMTPTAAARRISELQAQVEALTKERDEARQIVRDIHWMAVRYADGRRSYAPGMLNDALRKAYDGAWLVYQEFRQHDLDPQYARDGDKPEYRSIEARRDEHAARAQLLETALRRCQSVLAMMIQPDAIKNSSVLHAFTQATEAEAIARAALSPSTNGAEK